MATALDRVMAPAPTDTPAERRRRPAAVLLAPAAVALTAWGAVLARHPHGASTEWLRVALTAAWALAGTLVVLRRPQERIGQLALRATAVGAVPSLSASALRAHAHGMALSSAPVVIAELGRAFGV